MARKCEVPRGHTTYSWVGNARVVKPPAGHTNMSWGNGIVARGSVLNKLGRMLFQKKQVEEAEKAYVAALSASPGCTFAAYNYGVALEEMGRRTRAKDMFKWSLATDPAFVEAANALAAIELKSGENMQEVVRLCEIVLESKPNDSQAICNIGNALRRMGQMSRAISFAWDKLESAKNCGTSLPRRISESWLPPEKQFPVAVVCVKWGRKYGPEYVNRLFYGVRRHLSCMESFHCFTEDSSGLDSEIQAHCFPNNNFFGWWNKASVLFSSHLAWSIDRNGQGRKVVYLDLDTVICGSLDDIVRYDGFIGLLGSGEFSATEGRPDGFNSSVVIFSTCNKALWQVSSLIETLGLQLVSSYVHRLDYWLEMVVGDRGDILQAIFPGQLVDFKTHVQSNHGKVPEGARIINFPLNPKPHECIHEPWIREHWLGVGEIEH